MSAFVPSDTEAALHDWLDLAMTGLSPKPQVIYADQAKPYPDYPFVTIKVLSELITNPNPEKKVLDEELPNGNFTEQITTRYDGTVSVQFFGPNHVQLARRAIASLGWSSVQEQAQQNSISVSVPENGRINTTELLGAVPEPRSVIDFTYRFAECVETPDGVGVIETVIATGDVGSVQIVAQEPPP